MRTVRGMRLRQWLLLGLLAFALVSMHHMPTVPCDSHVAVAAQHAPVEECHEPTAGHDLLHLCLMVLAFVAALLLVWPLLAVSRTPDRGRAPIGWWRPPPGLAGRSLLTSVCVLRT